jgi:cystathionine gamma-synthase
MGADFSMNSVTKFISGHSDVLMGSVSSNNPELLNRVGDIRKFGGAIPGPFEAWLALRGIRTLALRLDRSQQNAMELATRLAAHPKIARVRYPGLVSDPHHVRAKAFMAGFGAVLAFEIVGTPEQADQITASSELISFATSLGGVETLWERRHRWSSESPSIPLNLIRMSVGIEDVEDLWQDVLQAIAKVLG